MISAEMLARHPITGQPIKILRTSTSTYSDLKTLVWIRESYAKGTAWSRWFTVISDISGIDIVGDSTKITAVILDKTATISAWLPVLPTLIHAKSDTLLIAPAAVLAALEKGGFEAAENVLTAEDIYDSYPFIGSVLTGDDDVATMVISLAHILRMNKLVWSGVERVGRVGTQLAAWQSVMGGIVQDIPMDSSDLVVPRTWLIQQYFRHSNNRRAREIHNCLEKNIAAGLIDNILLLNEEEYKEMPTSDKITVIHHPHRLTYYDVLVTAIDKVPKGDIVIFSNSDIYFDGTLSHLWRMKLAERRLFLSLLRWEDTGVNPTIFGPRADSQDAWICARDTLDFTPLREDFDFPFGKPGCDNVIGILMMKKRFLVVNPAYSIKTYHLHSSNLRNYDPHDVLYRPNFLYVEPSALQVLSIGNDMTPFKTDIVKHRSGMSFSRPILGVDDSHVGTVISMIQYAGNKGYTASGSNLFTPSSPLQSVYHFKNGAFTSCTGLVHDFERMYVGNNKLWETMWNSANLNTLTPSIHVPHLIVYPCDEKLRTSLSQWVLTYLPRVLQIRKAVKTEGLSVPEFLVPQAMFISDFLNDCDWSAYSSDKKQITVVPMMDTMNYYSTDLWVAPPDANTAITKEDIDILRAMMPKPPGEKAGAPVVVLCVTDDETSVCNRLWADSVAEHIFGESKNGWQVKYVSETSTPVVIRKAFESASWIIGAGKVLDWMWYAKERTHIMEFMSIDKPDADHIHLAGACGHSYVLGGVIRESIENARQNALLSVGRAIQKYGFSDTLSAIRTKKTVGKPTVIVPTGAGLHGIMNHSGDTFREMVALWGERGYVNIVQSSETGHCWWDEIGGVLLYDRPTPRWWNSETPYQMALFGNCAPPGPDFQRQSLWSFWPRSPREIEGVAERCDNLRGYDSRSIGSLFLGKIENGVQKAARTGVDWSTSVELFSMPIDSTGAPYPYTQKQYLEKLCQARYGLCLPGFGPKCNREIEYFACGTVPIVTPGVDMKGYLVPPVEGVHYFTAKTPADVQRIVKETDPKVWARMSTACRTWWRNYASAEGMFRLTWARIEQCRPYLAVGIPKNFSI